MTQNLKEAVDSFNGTFEIFKSWFYEKIVNLKEKVSISYK